MRGIHYLTDDNGQRTAVVIDIQTYGEALEDFLDGLEAEARKAEPKEDFNEAVERIVAEKQNG
ncbi:hypothetical protein [Spirosoma montaniterrae]|uniref:Uncharacterized protein n=1 Tax=Spirosoma montaniterrae TaxID=1178516 RepID=A0A1P9WVJ8_9BACT|nr:hypothetical protein [Spirosoma montaniterrae]AQG79399.1 hypothetical protein AWR27_08750 [Spirosoma montaniterrae]